MGQQFTHLDAAESAFFERELEHIYSQTYDIIYPDLKARVYVPVSNAANPGATSVTYRQMDKRGQAKIVGDSPDDVPRVEVLGEEFNRPVRTVAAAYGYNVMELRSALMANRSLNAMKAEAARRAVEEELDHIACFGDASYGIVDGFLNNASVSVTPAGATFAASTPDAIVAFFAAAQARIDTATLGTEKPDTVLLPDAVWTDLATRRLTDTGDTLLSFLLRSFPTINAIEPWYRLNAAGAGATTRMVMYKRDASKLTQEIPSEFEQLPVQERNLDFIVNTMARTAGTAIYYPLGVDYLDGV